MLKIGNPVHLFTGDVRFKPHSWIHDFNILTVNNGFQRLGFVLVESANQLFGQLLYFPFFLTFDMGKEMGGIGIHCRQSMADTPEARVQHVGQHAGIGFYHLKHTMQVESVNGTSYPTAAETSNITH